MRHSTKNTKQDIDEETEKLWWKAVEEADRKGEVVNFLKNTLTESERLMLGRRLMISSLLLRGLTQMEIRFLLDLSPNTTWKVKRWLEKEIPEYGVVLKQVDIEAESKRSRNDRSKTQEHLQPFSSAWLKRKYPMHFLILNVADAVIDRLRESSERRHRR